ncbi:MAG: tetratricopeptide repeat protein [Anaerolineaceae bacterium]|nr:tetratricopeptide repeat protein [Anaerolineaceae bacterium]
MGGFRFEAEGTPSFHFGTKKARALLVYLAVEAPRSFLRSHLAGLLWSDYTEEKALHNLRQTLVHLRKGWPQGAEPIPLLLTRRDTLALNPEVKIWVDLHAFEAAFDRALVHFHDRKRLERVDIQALMEAVALYQGPFLERFSLFDSQLFDEWASLVRERTTKKALEAQTLLCEYHERRGDYAQAGHLASRIYAMAPWNNHACAHSMRLYAIQKQWTNAKNQYLQLEKYLQDNLGNQPNDSVTQLYQQIREHSNTGQALPPSIPVVDDEIPQLASSFVGRHGELQDICHRLSNPKNRLISLVGRGGTGKTRLAVEVGHRMRGLYAHGVFFIPLRDLISVDGLDRLMEERLKCSFPGTISLHRQLMDFLCEKQCLLILDGCEHHLLQSAIRKIVSEVLSIAPDVKILATSRERLKLPEEHVYPLAGLSCQVEMLTVGGAVGSSSEALTLFEARARQINHQFALTETSLPMVEQLCFKVEGHPLSIELIASATATLSIPDLLDELNANSGVWNPTQMIEPSESRSLSIVLERSWVLLSEAQRLVLCRLVSFQGGFTQGAALHIAQTSLDIFQSLVDKSFIHKVGENRYILHEIIQEFATKKAIRRNLLKPTREAHAAYFIALLEKIGRENQFSLQIYTLEQIETDLDNILCAWAYFIEKNAIARLKNCIEILYQFFNIRSRFEEGILLFQNAIHSASYLAPFDPLIGVMTNRLGSLALRMRQNEMSVKMFTRSLAIFDKDGDSVELGLVYIGLGNYYLRVKDMNQALSNAHKALACFKNLVNGYHEGTVLYLLGMIYQRFADYPKAKIKFSQSLEISRAFGDQRGMISRLNQLAGHDCNAGDFESAEERYLESLELSRAFKDRFQQAIILNNLASVYHPRKEYDKEQSVLLESLAICREIGDQDGEAIALNNLAELAIVCGEYQQALNYSRAALDIALRLGEDWTIIAVYDILGCAYLGLEDSETAEQCLLQAIHMAHQIQSWDLLTRSLVHMAEVHLVRDNHHTAQELLTAALSHPSVLYEYGLKAVDLLGEMGVEPPGEKDVGVFVDVMDRHFELKSAEG